MNRGALRSPMALGGLAIIAVLMVVAVFAPLIAPYDPKAPSGPALEPPSGAHPLGTDAIGADVLSQLIWGARVALQIAVPAGALAVAVGALAGVGAGLLGGRADQVAARVLDGFLALPMLPLLILLAAFAGPSPPVLIVIIAMAGWAPTARILRAQTLTLRQRGFLAVARGLGGGRFYLMRRHLFPALGPLIVAVLVNWTGLAFVLHASLTFLGIGDPTDVSWGMIINRALEGQGIYTSGGWTWLVLPAGLAITVAVMGFTLLGVSLETSFNPRSLRGASEYAGGAVDGAGEYMAATGGAVHGAGEYAAGAGAADGAGRYPTGAGGAADGAGEHPAGAGGAAGDRENGEPAGLLEVRDLAVAYEGGVEALGGVSFRLARGESLAIVGESGAGKTTLAHCLTGLVQPPTARGSVRVGGRELLGAPAAELRALRWDTVALAVQGTPFNPVVAVGDQVAEPLRTHRGMDRREARRQAEELAREVLLDPALLQRFPHQLSGGQRRQAMLAMTLALDPDLVVLDEPTAGLDPARREELVERIGVLAQQRGFGLVVISHDLADAARMASRTVVLYAGTAVETGPTEAVIGDAAHPYTWALVGAYPVMSTTRDLRPIRGTAPDPRAVPSGCPYHPRCTQAEQICREQRPPLEPSRGRLVACHFGGLKTLLSATGVHKTFGRGRNEVRAVRGVSLHLREGESLGIVGPSGSGKTTLARILAGHLAPDAGDVVLEGTPLSNSWRRQARMARRRTQLVMQDPADALSPRLPVAALVREPLDLAGEEAPAARDAAVATALASVGLPSSGAFTRALAHELSGGQQQRVALARALVAHPKLLVADEPTSMLDPSEQARLLVVLRERQVELGIGLVLVSHDVALVRKVTDRMVVLDGGEVVEEGPAHTVSSAPESPTARRMVAAAPTFTVPTPARSVPASTTPAMPLEEPADERNAP